MGFSIQRGATCTVAAVDEVFTQGRATRLLALLEAALWVGAGLIVAQAWGLLGHMPKGYGLGWQTVLGGVLLGAGAYVNRACVFGAIARLSSGDWAYVATPVGFFAGCWLFHRTLHGMSLGALGQGSPVLQVPSWVAMVLAGTMLLRVGWGLRTVHRSHDPAADARGFLARSASATWRPAPATVLIGITFLFMMLLAGPWAYTEVLSDWARGMAPSAAVRMALALALFGGAAWGGWHAGKWRRVAPRPAMLARCFTGGAMMGLGSLFIPGGNDGLILVGMPLLWPYAWLAFGTMCISIAALMWLKRA
ncbi:MAG: YeeE/YedE family protein [Rubrivivax sp.]|nr:MAG: YeeE/YedE family protein [Rubrivivax sp.]